MGTVEPRYQNTVDNLDENNATIRHVRVLSCSSSIRIKAVLQIPVNFHQKNDFFGQILTITRNFNLFYQTLFLHIVMKTQHLILASINLRFF